MNDLSQNVANLWRALQSDPGEVWRVASAPCSEVELKARAKWLKAWTSPDFADLSACDPYAAGIWLWVSCVTIAPDGDSLQRGNHGKGIKGCNFTRAWYDAVCERMARVQVLCGDWSRCVTRAAVQLDTCATVGVFLDPPYGEGSGVEYEDGTGAVAAEVWEWAIENGNNHRLRIVVAGYQDSRTLPSGWTAIERTEKGGYGSGNGNRHRERLWCSPHCQRNQPSLFE